MANASKKGGGMGSGTVGHQHVGTTDPDIFDEHDLADEIGDRNSLQGENQARNRNQRLTQPGSLNENNQPPPVADPNAPEGSNADDPKRRRS